ncbi:MAG: type III pantothenate kinase [Ignavibacteriae bacterium]|nr:type III pantothenate kinase [Ignavibacteriota bacterium]
MILCLDIGNTQIHGGVFERSEIKLQFRKTSRGQFSSDEIGLFLKSVLTENKINWNEIKNISICSVVPDILHSIISGCIKYFQINPFILKAGVKTGLKIKYRNPLEVGTDRIANAIAAQKLFPSKNSIVVDFGTATTFDVITKAKEYLGGLIIPGIRLSMESLNKNTAQLPNVEIFKPQNVVGRSTEESIRSGLYFGQKSIVESIKKQIMREVFFNDEAILIATGGFSSLFENENLFDVTIPDLVLIGLHEAFQMNHKAE